MNPVPQHGGSVMQLPEGDTERVFRSRLDSSGRIVLPREVRERMSLKIGDGILLVDDANGVRLETPEQSLREAQLYFSKLVEPGVSVVDELLRERRQEVAYE